jgi:TRAP-type mannitol/chloroaromatic compound transport system permease small subunit
MQLLRSIITRIERITEWVGSASSWLVLLMVVLGACNAAGRYVGEYIGVTLSSNALAEGQWYAFSMIFLLGAADTLRQDKHVRVDLIYGRLGTRGRAITNLIGGLLALLPFCFAVLYFSWPSVSESWRVFEQSADPGGLPRYPIKSVILVAFVLLALQGFATTAKQVVRLYEPSVKGES